MPRPRPARGGPARQTATAYLRGLGLPIEARPRHVHVAGDIALLIVDRSIRGTAPDGTDIHLAGTATDVARHGADGCRRYVIDNPFGTS